MEGLPVSMQGGYQEGGMIPLQTMMVWSLVFETRWDKLFPYDSFFNEIHLTEKLFLEVFIEVSFNFVAFFPTQFFLSFNF